MVANVRQLEAAMLSAEEVLANVQRLYARLQLLPHEVGTNRRSATYQHLEAEIRMWADRYSQISGVSDISS
jgi:hypothetical protein